MSRRNGVFVALISLLSLCSINLASAQSAEEDLIHANDSFKKIGPVLAKIYKGSQLAQTQRSVGVRSGSALMRQADSAVGVDLYATDEVTLRRDLAALGATNVKNRGPLFSARVPVTRLGALAALPSLRFA